MENTIAQLSGHALKLLCFLAYHGGDQGTPGQSVGPDYRTATKTSKKAYDQALRDLSDKGFVNYGTKVAPGWQILALKTLFNEHPSWVEQFREIAPASRTRIAEYLCHIVWHIEKGDGAAVMTMPRPPVGTNREPLHLIDYLQPNSPDSLPYLCLLDDDEMRSMTDNCLESLLLSDALTRDILNTIQSVVSPNSPHRDELLDQIGAYRHLLFAEPFAASGSPTLWSKAMEALRLLYDGRYAESAITFRSALQSLSPAPGASRTPLLSHLIRRVSPQTGKDTPGAFRNPLLNYAYGIALYHATHQDSNSDITNAAKAFINDTDLANKDPHFCIRLLLANIERTRETQDLHRADLVLARHDDPFYNTFASLLFGFFNMPFDKGTPSGLHTAAFLRHEASLFIPIGPTLRQQYASAFGGRPLLDTITRKNNWETIFNEIEVIASQSLQIEKRIVYHLKGLTLSAIVEQEKQYNAWHDIRQLTPADMLHNNCPSMDNTDRLIAKHLIGTDSSMAGQYIIPLLADSGRILWCDYRNKVCGPITVHRIAPRLSLEVKADKICITSNVPSDTTGHLMRNTVNILGSGQFNLISLNATQQELIERFLSLKQIPATALPSVKKALASLRSYVEVDDDNIDQLLDSTIHSTGLLAVRIVPAKNGSLFTISIMAKAAENGTCRFVPADGDELVYDVIDDVTHCICRNFPAELDNYNALADLMEQDFQAEFTSFTEATIASPESLLNLLAFAYEHPEQYHLEWPEGRQLKFRGHLRPSDIQINVASRQQWFSVEGRVASEHLDIPLEDLVRSCCNDTVGSFVRIGEDEYIRMTEQLRKQIAALAVLPSLGDGTHAVPHYQIGALAATINGLNAEKDDAYLAFEEKTRQAYALEAPIPDALQATLRPYQVEGYRWLCRLDAWGACACLADDMGLGKTLQAITFLLHKAADGPSLVVAPKTVLPNWATELHRFAPTLHVVNLNEAPDRQQLINGIGPGSIVLCTYGVLVSQIDLLAAQAWNVVCLDEAQQIKNRTTLSCKAALRLNASRRLILTSTPLQNNLGELWTLFQFLNPGLLGPWGRFHDTFMAHELDDRHRQMLKEMTLPFILRRTKQEVLDELPEKIVREQMVELTDDEARVYEEMRRRAEIKFKSGKTKEEQAEAAQLRINFFAELTKLRLAACDMHLVHEQWRAPASKTTEALRLIDELLANPDNSIIVFSQFTSFLDILKRALDKRHIAYLYLDGQTPIDIRQSQVEDFQQGRCRLFLSSLKAGGLGINLTAANQVLLLDPWWNPAIENQAMDRAHRLGQKRIVTVTRLISAHTIEEKILHLHADKQHLTDDILEGTGQSSRLTYEDIMEMLSPFDQTAPHPLTN